MSLIDANALSETEFVFMSAKDYQAIVNCLENVLTLLKNMDGRSNDPSFHVVDTTTPTPAPPAQPDPATRHQKDL